MIRIDQLWLCTAPMDMRAGAERLMSCVVQTIGAAHAHHGYLFANSRATRIKRERLAVPPCLPGIGARGWCPPIPLVDTYALQIWPSAAPQ